MTLAGGGAGAARAAAIAPRHSLRSRLRDEGRGHQARACSVRGERYLPARHIHHLSSVVDRQTGSGHHLPRARLRHDARVTGGAARLVLCPNSGAHVRSRAPGGGRIPSRAIVRACPEPAIPTATFVLFSATADGREVVWVGDGLANRSRTRPQAAPDAPASASGGAAAVYMLTYGDSLLERQRVLLGPRLQRRARCPAARAAPSGPC